jgi:porin
MIAVEHFTNPTGFGFTNNHPCETRSIGTPICYNSPRELFIDEIGYKTDAAPGNLSTWVRLTGYYNTTHYNDLTFTGTTGSGNTNGNYAVSLYADQQVLQFQPGSPQTAYQGFYIGGTVGRNDPKAAALEQTYELRAYTYGLFGRPRDQLALSYQHIVVSHYLADGLNSTSSCSGATAAFFGGPLVCARHALNTYSLTYTAAIIPGVSATMGAQYIDHPAIVWSPYMTSIANGGKGFGTAAATTPPFSSLNKYNINHALNLVASLYLVF